LDEDDTNCNKMGIIKDEEECEDEVLDTEEED
jgi:hypothetical protein